jgi:hypothetical protein
LVADVVPCNARSGGWDYNIRSARYTDAGCTAGESNVEMFAHDRCYNDGTGARCGLVVRCCLRTVRLPASGVGVLNRRRGFCLLTARAVFRVPRAGGSFYMRCDDGEPLAFFLLHVAALMLFVPLAWSDGDRIESKWGCCSPEREMCPDYKT